MAAQLPTPQVHLVDGQPVTSSREVATYFQRRHDDLLKRIRNLDCSDEFRRRNFSETVYERPNPSGGAPIPATEYQITRDGFTFLAMGFTGKKAARFKEAYIEAFNQLERQAQPQPPALPPHMITHNYLVSIENGQVTSSRYLPPGTFVGTLEELEQTFRSHGKTVVDTQWLQMFTACADQVYRDSENLARNLVNLEALRSELDDLKRRHHWR